MTPSAMATIVADRALAVVRAPEIPDPVALADALAQSGDLRGPFPDVATIPSGGVNAGNAADFLARGAVAVSAGTGVVPPDTVAAGDWSDIASRAASFVKSLN